MEVTIGVHGMTCGHCQKRVADAISSLEGVESIEVDLEAENATVSFNPQKVSLDNIKEAIRKAGYSTEIEEKTEEETKEPEESSQACPLNTQECRFEPSLISPGEIEETIESIGYKAEKDKVTLDLQGMSCVACAANIEKVLNKTEGVISASVNFPLAKAVV
jgi:Cu+-exporting ATPase